MSDLIRELAAVINRHSLERQGGDTPDFLLAEYLVKSLEVFGETVAARKAWGGERPSDMQQLPLPATNGGHAVLPVDERMYAHYRALLLRKESTLCHVGQVVATCAELIATGQPQEAQRILTDLVPMLAHVAVQLPEDKEGNV